MIHVSLLNVYGQKTIDATLITSGLLKWTRPQTHVLIATIMDQAINQGFLAYWIINWFT